MRKVFLREVTVEHHFPQEAANKMGPIVQDCKERETDGVVSYVCRRTYARLVPQLWLPGVSTLAMLDFTHPYRGPMFFGDICDLRKLGSIASGNGTGTICPSNSRHFHKRRREKECVTVRDNLWCQDSVSIAT